MITKKEATKLVKDEPTLRLLSEKEVKMLHATVIDIPGAETSRVLKKVVRVLEAVMFLRIRERLEKELGQVRREGVKKGNGGKEVNKG